MVKRFVLVTSRETGLPLVDKDRSPIMFERKTSDDDDTAVLLAGFLSLLEGFSKDVIPLSASFHIGKKLWCALYSTIENPFPLAVLAINDKFPLDDPYNTSRFLSYRLKTFLMKNSIISPQSVDLRVNASGKTSQKFCRKLLGDFGKKKGKDISDQEIQEIVLCVAQLEDILSLKNTRGFFIPQKQAVDILGEKFSSEDRKLLRTYISHDKAISVSLSFLDAILNSMDPQEKERIIPNSIELLHRMDYQTKYIIRFFSPKKKRKGPIPGWLILTTTNSLVVAASRHAGKVDSEYTKSTLNPDELEVLISNLQLQSEFTEFENLMRHNLGPISISGIRGVIDLLDLMKIGTKEGKAEVEISAGIQRIRDDASLQERLVSSLEKKQKKY